MTPRMLLIAIGQLPLSFRRTMAIVYGLVMAAALVRASEVAGTILDPSGAVVPAAKVTLKGSGKHQGTVSDHLGNFRFEDVAPGAYQLSVVGTGFEPTLTSLSIG